MQKPKSVVFIGASGNMCQMVVQRFAKASSAPLVLADIVVEPVMKACLEAKVPYPDFDHHVESTQAALDLHEQARKAGVQFYIYCGASPCLTNAMVTDATKELDVVMAIEIYWLVGAENSGAGRAVAHHLMHIAAGPCLTWGNGKPTLKEIFEDTTYVPIRGTSDMILHEDAHPEPVTLPRLLPKGDSICCFCGLYPAPRFGVARGLAVAVRHGRLAIDDAIDFQLSVRRGSMPATTCGAFLREFADVVAGGVDISSQKGKTLLNQAGGSSDLLTYAVQGLADQVASGE